MKRKIEATVEAPCSLHNPEKYYSICYGIIEELSDSSEKVELRTGKIVPVPISILKALELPLMKD